MLCFTSTSKGIVCLVQVTGGTDPIELVFANISESCIHLNPRPQLLPIASPTMADRRPLQKNIMFNNCILMGGTYIMNTINQGALRGTY